MGHIASILGISAAERQSINSIGERIVYDAAMQYVLARQEEIALTTSALIGAETELWQEQYALPGGGMLPPVSGDTAAPTRRTLGSWSVAYPLATYGASLGYTKEVLGYTTPDGFELQVNGIIEAGLNRLRHEILRRLFKNTVDSITEAYPAGATLTVQPLANGDSVVYPPVEGSNTEATDNHYLASGYAANTISNTNNPLRTLADELYEHFPATTGGINGVVFINNAQTALISALTEFDAVVDNFIRAGSNTDVPINLPNVPGKIIGRANVSGVWVVEWRWIPADYMLALNLEADGPLKMRVDMASSGLPRGLHMSFTDPNRPIQTMEWKHRFGIGASNRLNGVVMQLTTGSYTIPSAYA
jgi:hypothetical protein